MILISIPKQISIIGHFATYNANLHLYISFFSRKIKIKLEAEAFY